MSTPRVRALVASTALIMSGAVIVLQGPAQAHTTGIHDNCTKLHTKWPHGVGRRGAHDQTTSGDPVTNFHRSNKQYRRAVNHNSTLDADHDKIACEAH